LRAKAGNDQERKSNDSSESSDQYRLGRQEGPGHKRCPLRTSAGESLAHTPPRTVRPLKLLWCQSG
jgi:hypothetical protein